MERFADSDWATVGAESYCLGEAVGIEDDVPGYDSGRYA
jgi:hypothetical protein